MTDLEADPSMKAVVFQSANSDFFIAHLDVTKAAERPEMMGLWRDFVRRLSSAPVVSIGKIRRRTRSIGNEIAPKSKKMPTAMIPFADFAWTSISNSE
jgi:enoyl-CoA hydratase/carnithine racemase